MPTDTCCHKSIATFQLTGITKTAQANAHLAATDANLP